MPQPFSRRSFLHLSSGAALSLAEIARSSSARGAVSPNEKITLGLIGVAGRGNADMDAFMAEPDVQIGAICDVYELHLNAALQKAGGKAKGYKDFRKLLEQKDLDAVVIATPPHWHPLITIAACEAGKDVYVEKPMTLYPGEIRPVLKAARENKRVTQVGTQIHATSNYRRVVDLVRSGMLGKITAVRNIMFLDEAPGTLGHPPNSAPPPDLDWEMWLGPAPSRSFNPTLLVDGHHRYFKDLVGSWLHELGPHIVDLPVWALQLGPPISASATGGRFAYTDISDIPDTLDVAWEYPGMIMTWHHCAANAYPFHWHDDPLGGRRIAVVFQGTDATLVADYDRCEILKEGNRLQNVKIPEPSPPSPGHHREFLNSIKSREQPNCNVEYHANVHAALNLGQLAYKVGRKVVWDAKAGKVINDREADRLSTPNYRKPWSLPK